MGRANAGRDWVEVGRAVFVTPSVLALAGLPSPADLAEIVAEGVIVRGPRGDVVPRWRVPGEGFDRCGFLDGFDFFPDRRSALVFLRELAELELDRWGRLLERVRAEAKADAESATPTLFPAGGAA